MKTVAEPKFKRGQVVKLDCSFYKAKERKAQMYQRIKYVALWRSGDPKFGYALRFANGDVCHEKYAVALTAREAGR